MIKPGYEIKLRKGLFEQSVIVQGIVTRRVSAVLAQELYTETEASQQQREKLHLALKSQPVMQDLKRPNKKQRREAQRYKRGG
jgi:ribosome-associated heat shock protein Hsp15